MNVLYTNSINLGFETFVAPANFDRSAQPIDIYRVFKDNYKTNRYADYIFSVPDTFSNYLGLAANETPIHCTGTSYIYGYESAGISYTKDVKLTTLVGSYPDANYTTIEVVSTDGYPASGKIVLGEGYGMAWYNNTPYSCFFTYTSKDATHFYGVSQRVKSFGTIVSPVIDWTGTTKRWVISNNTNLNMHKIELSNYIKAEWLYAGNKVNSIACGTGSIGGSTVKWIHIHKLNNITSYDYCCFYQCNLYGELHLSSNPACTYINSLSFPGQTNITGVLNIPGNITEIDGTYGTAFSGGFTGFILNEGLLKIGTNAFRNNFYITNPITLPSTLISIGHYAFMNFGLHNSDVGLSLNIPANVTTINYGAFADSRFTNFTSASSNYIIEDNTIYDVTGGGCKALHGDIFRTDNITLKTTVTEILYGCFQNSRRTGSLILPNSLNIVGYNAFYNSQSLTGALNTNNVVTISTSAFYNTRFTSVTFTNSLATLGSDSFANITSATGSLTIPDSVTSIGSGAIRGYGGTGTLTLPNSNCVIEYSAFYGAKFTGTLNIPANIISIGSSAFSAIPITTITSSNVNYPVYDNVLYDVKTSGKVKVLAGPAGASGTLTLRADTTEILAYALENNYHRTGSFVIPSTVTTIGDRAAMGCAGFTGNLIIPSNVQTIGSNTFYGLSGITGSIIINNPNITLSIQNNTNHSFSNNSNVTGLELVAGYNDNPKFGGISDNFSASSLNQSILNLTDGTAGSPKTIYIGVANKNRLLASYPNAEIDANVRYINIL